MLENYKLLISYDGSRYLGWERQPGIDRTIQGKIEAVLTRMLSAEGELRQPVDLIGAGRTDAGVHARGMCANVFLDSKRSEGEIRAYLNRYLPDDISVDALSICGKRFHARYHARGKLYRYSCYFGEKKPVFERKYLLILPEMPDVERMRLAAEALIGEKDYRSFCGNPRMKKSTLRRIDRIEILERKGCLRFYFHGSGFLQHQIRIMVGTLLEIGFGKREPGDMERILLAKDRSQAGYTAEAGGLCLMRVDY